MPPGLGLHREKSVALIAHVPHAKPSACCCAVSWNSGAQKNDESSGLAHIARPVAGRNCRIRRSDCAFRSPPLSTNFLAFHGQHQPVGRPLQASEAQCEHVRKLRKVGKSLRWIAEETSLTLSTVRTIVSKADGTDRTSQKRNGAASCSTATKRSGTAAASATGTRCHDRRR